MSRFNPKSPWTVAIDFDGTIRKEKLYSVGDWPKWTLVDGFQEFYRWARDRGINMLLWTSRNMAQEKDRNSVFAFLRVNALPVIYTPVYSSDSETVCVDCLGQEIKVWSTGSDKIYADFYVDDLSVGTPLNRDGTVNWRKVKSLISREIRRVEALQKSKGV